MDAAPLRPPAIYAPAPREVSFGRIEGRVSKGTSEVRVRVDGRLVATKTVTRPRFALVVTLPQRDVTIRVSAIDGRGRHASTLVGPVFGLPRGGAPYSGPIPALRGHEDAALARTVRSLGRRFPGICGLFVQDLRTGAGAAWNARARFPAASTLKLAIAVELMRELRGVPAPGSQLAALLWRMLVYSDDRSANELLEVLGGSTSAARTRELDAPRARPADSGIAAARSDSLLSSAIPLEISGRPFISKATTAGDLARLEARTPPPGRAALIWRFRGAFTPSDFA